MTAIVARGFALGALALVGSTAAGGRGANSVKARGKTAVFRTHKGRVDAVALTSNRVAKSRGSIRSYMSFVPRKGTSARSSQVTGAPSNQLSPQSAVPLVAKHGASPIAMYCGL